MNQQTPEQIVELAQQRILARKEQERLLSAQQRQTRFSQERRWGYVLLAVLGILAIALLFTPGLPLQWKMYSIVHGICAQQHTIALGGVQLPVCARNTGIYTSFLLTLFSLLALGRSRAGRLPPWTISVVLAVFVLMMGIDGFNSLFYDIGMTTLYTPRNDLRTLTGMGMGVSIGVAVLLVFNLSLLKEVDEQQPVLRNWWELGGVLLGNFLLLAAIYGNLDLMYWPLAFLSFFGIISVLYIVNVLACSVLLGYSGMVTHLVQLARPATLAIVPTAVMLGVLAFLRFWLEGQGLLL